MATGEIHNGGRSGDNGLPIPFLRVGADDRLVLDIPRPKFHFLVFGCNLIGLARVLLARLSGQADAELLAGYLAVIPVAAVLAAVASKRMRDRTPRLFTSGLSIVAVTLYALPSGVSVLPPPSVASDRVALMTMIGLGTCTGAVEILHRLAARRRS